MPPLRQRAVQAVVVAVALQALFVFFFVFPGHDPEPRGLPVAVAGPAELPPGFDAIRVESAAAGEALVREREVYGVVAPPELIVASAASMPVRTLLEAVAGRAGGLTVRDVAPLPEGDPRGVSLNLLVLPLTITAILFAIVSTGLVPELAVGRRVLLAALASLLGGLVAISIANLWLDALGGPWAAEWLEVALGVVAIALVSAGLIRLLGPAATAVPFLLFLMLGNPASGLASAPELLPSPWAELGGLLPPGALGSALRGTAYFDGAGVPGPLLVLAAWAAIGVGLNVAAGRRPPPAAEA